MLRLEVFHGDANPTEAHVYAQVRGDDLVGLAISGTLAGPHSKYARTLPAKISFRDLGNNLAEALVPDPCFWTPENPFTYDVAIEIRRGAQPVLAEQRLFGLRPLGVRGKDFVLQGRRWVLRGVMRTSQRVGLIETWHAAGAVMVFGADEMVYRETSRAGVLVVSGGLSEPGDLRGHLSELSRWPSVAMSLLRTPLDCEDIAASRPRNLLLAEFAVPHRNQGYLPEPWADAVVLDAHNPQAFAAQAARLTIPVIAYRSDATDATIEEARRACDLLQQDLASYGDFAGYIV